MAKVSIVVPVYKVEAYLRNCLNSILNQTYQDLQVILVDDGSPDRCGAICDEYAQKDTRVLALHKKNGGVSSARNFALDYADGEYITFCDSDDAYAPAWIEQLVAAMQAHQADVVVGGFTFVYEDGTPCKTNPHVAGVWSAEPPEEKLEYSFRYVMNPAHGWEIWDRLYRRDIISQNQIRFCETCGNYAEDLGFTLACSLYAKRVAVIESCGYLYTVRGGSMMQTSARIPKLDSLNEVYLSFAPVCQRALPRELAQWALPRFYLEMIGSQFISKLWSSGMEPEELRKAAIAGVKNWPEMEVHLRSVLDSDGRWNPWNSGSENVERICHIRYLLDGSWMKLRIQCKLIRMFRSLLNAYGRLKSAKTERNGWGKDFNADD